MSGRIVRLDASTHQAVQELLPWYVAKTLEGDEREFVLEHLHSCSQCRADVEWQNRLREIDQDQAAFPDVETALAKLGSQLDRRQHPPVGNALVGFVRKLFFRPSLMYWTLATQSVAVVCLAAVLILHQRQPAEYRGLGAEAAEANLVVQFDPKTSEQEFRRILRLSGVRLVGGPTVTGGYLLQVVHGRKAQALSALRAEPAVILAQSLATEEKAQ